MHQMAAHSFISIFLKFIKEIGSVAVMEPLAGMCLPGLAKVSSLVKEYSVDEQHSRAAAD